MAIKYYRPDGTHVVFNQTTPRNIQLVDATTTYPLEKIYFNGTLIWAKGYKMYFEESAHIVGSAINSTSGVFITLRRIFTNTPISLGGSLSSYVSSSTDIRDNKIDVYAGDIFEVVKMRCNGGSPVELDGNAEYEYYTASTYNIFRQGKYKIPNDISGDIVFTESSTNYTVLSPVTVSYSKSNLSTITITNNQPVSKSVYIMMAKRQNTESTEDSDEDDTSASYWISTTIGAAAVGSSTSKTINMNNGSTVEGGYYDVYIETVHRYQKNSRVSSTTNFAFDAELSVPINKKPFCLISLNDKGFISIGVKNRNTRRVYCTIKLYGKNTSMNPNGYGNDTILYKGELDGHEYFKFFENADTWEYVHNKYCPEYTSGSEYTAKVVVTFYKDETYDSTNSKSRTLTATQEKVFTTSVAVRGIFDTLSSALINAAEAIGVNINPDWKNDALLVTENHICSTEKFNYISEAFGNVIIPANTIYHITHPPEVTFGWIKAANLSNSNLENCVLEYPTNINFDLADSFGMGILRVICRFLYLPWGKVNIKLNLPPHDSTEWYLVCRFNSKRDRTIVADLAAQQPLYCDAYVTSA